MPKIPVKIIDLIARQDKKHREQEEAIQRARASMYLEDRFGVEFGKITVDCINSLVVEQEDINEDR